ncbi:MAG TPA: histidinol-phosphatase [Acidimicrobiia bacterium]|nr:histidinol-phosphatase [Acidimicrobiia bacterium]
MSDYHLHLHPHEPSVAGPPPAEYPPDHIEAYVEAAAARGVGELGFTEHLYRCVESEGPLGRFWDGEEHRDLAEHTAGFVAEDRNLSLEAYVTAVTNAKDRGLPVKLGLEVDFFPDTIEAVSELLSPYPWDYLIGSVHWIGGWAIDSSSSLVGWDHKGLEWAWNAYFDLTVALAGSAEVDVLAHVDLPKKYGKRLPSEPVARYDEVIEAAVRTQTAVEVSSQGLRKPAAEVYPSPAFLRRFHAAGVPITLASDGHFPHEAGEGHAEVVAAARAAGYTSHLRFDRRRRYSVELPPLSEML